MSDLLTPTKVDPLEAEQAAVLDRDGYLLLRGAVPKAWRAALRATFDTGVGPQDRWAAPRGSGWRHALVDLDPTVQRTCSLPPCWRRRGGCWAARSSSARPKAASPCQTLAISPCIATARG